MPMNWPQTSGQPGCFTARTETPPTGPPTTTPPGTTCATASWARPGAACSARISASRRPPTCAPGQPDHSRVRCARTCPRLPAGACFAPPRRRRRTTAPLSDWATPGPAGGDTAHPSRLPGVAHRPRTLLRRRDVRRLPGAGRGPLHHRSHARHRRRHHPAGMAARPRIFAQLRPPAGRRAGTRHHQATHPPRWTSLGRWYLIRNDRDRYFDEVHALATTPILGGWVDHTALRTILTNWPWGQVHGPDRMSVIAMNRILSLAAFVRTATDWLA